jgi:hypothetical protein
MVPVKVVEELARLKALYDGFGYRESLLLDSGVVAFEDGVY